MIGTEILNEVVHGPSHGLLCVVVTPSFRQVPGLSSSDRIYDRMARAERGLVDRDGILVNTQRLLFGAGGVSRKGEPGDDSEACCGQWMIGTKVLAGQLERSRCDRHVLHRFRLAFI